MTTDSTTTSPKKQENVLLSLGLNIILPALILSKLSSEDRLGPFWGLIVALAFPIAYFVYDFFARRKYNFFSIVGFISILLTGGLGLLKMGILWFAIKEAAIPAIFGVAVLASLKTKTPLVRLMFFNPSVFDVPKVEGILRERNRLADFDRLLRNGTWILAGSFFLSAVLNFFLARYILVSEPGTSAFTEELGKLMWWSWPVIVLPCMGVMIYALIKMVKGLKGLTGLTMEEMMNEEHAQKAASKSS